MNPVLEEILRTGQVRSAAGDLVPLHSHISTAEGFFLQKIISNIKAAVSLEVGLGYGVSALFICDALKKSDVTRHIVIDPSQIVLSPINLGSGSCWQGIGLENLRRAGYQPIVEFYEKPSHLALPLLEERGVKLDFAFIDGWHTFDHALVDFFHIDRLLRVNGVIALDDTSFPSVRKLCRFIALNRSYKVLGCLARSDRGTPMSSMRRQLLRAMQGFPRSLRRVFKPEVLVPDAEIGLEAGGNCIAFRKEADDERRWDFHRDF